MYTFVVEQPFYHFFLFTMRIDYTQADISEDALQQEYPGILHALLRDNTRSPEGCTPDNQENICWATDDYKHLGDDFAADRPIRVALITNENGHVIMPRVSKPPTTQTARSKTKAEVFTPSWVCNAQNNLIDTAWFGREGVFNNEYTDADGNHRWQTNTEKIAFPEGRCWRDYVRDTRLEITCGEAPYVVSRYDPTTASVIPLPERIGMLDRKLRVVGENTRTSGEWTDWAKEALKSTYAYEWQGDNLLLARENVLVTLLEYYEHRFHRPMSRRSAMVIADIIAWNFWQMDGLTCGLPGQDTTEQLDALPLAIEPRQRLCRVANWQRKAGSTTKEVVIFKSLMKKQS